MKSHTNIRNIFVMSMAIDYASNYSSIFLLNASITHTHTHTHKKKKKKKKDGDMGVCIGCLM